MVQYETDLAFKNHMQFFTNLNNDMDQLRNISRVASDFNKLPLYYNELENLAIHYACYIKENILTELREVKNVIITVKYNDFLSGKLGKEEYGIFYQQVLDSIDTLKTIHSQFSQCLHDHELFPKLVKKEKKDKGKSLYN